MNWFTQISKRHCFTATFTRIGKGKYMRLEDVHRVDGIPFRDHIFLPYTKRLRKHNLHRGDQLLFSAKVNRYYKKYPSDIHRHPNRLIAQLDLTNIHLIHIERHSP